MELIYVAYKLNGVYDNVRCTSIERYGDKYSFSDRDGELIRKDGVILSVPIMDVLKITSK